MEGGSITSDRLTAWSRVANVFHRRGSHDHTATPADQGRRDTAPTSPSSTPKHSTGNFANDPGRAAEAGRKGGQASPTNFKHDPGRAAEAGRKGGRQSPGNFKQDTDRAREAGRKGGRQRSPHAS
ncbi:general stress protein [Chromohalobacter salexigens]|nr:general stress protein [Chromohalobacter salexigens]